MEIFELHYTDAIRDQEGLCSGDALRGAPMEDQKIYNCGEINDWLMTWASRSFVILGTSCTPSFLHRQIQSLTL